MRKNIITSSFKNIISFLKILTDHFTGVQKIITLCSIILMLSFVNITLCFSSNSVSALSYQGSANIGFTFNPTLSLSVSGDLTIPNLTPGSSVDSNSITASVATNTAYGYTITSTVGSSNSNNGNSTGNNSRNLVNSIDNNQSFTSLDYGSSIVDKTSFNDNTWGYSYSRDNGTTWKPYSGLPLYSDTTHSAVLFNTYSSAYSTSLDFKIAAKSSTTQTSGEYANIINFYAVSVPEPPLLYDVVQNMTKGTLADNNVKLSDTITQANSGVYTYDPAVYGTASDASNDYPIYFYRGILDTDSGLGTYGSDGLADAWPNYVKLNNGTCWRIVRTTGSGGVKMIYNGLYGATMAGSCGNAQGDENIGLAPFNNSSAAINGKTYYGLQSQNIQAVGYTYSNKVEPGATEPTALSDIFGASENDTTTNTNDSIIKQFIEDWYAANMASENYTSRLETGAGYCNDRSLYSHGSYNSNAVLIESTKVISYGNSNMGTYYFGAYARNKSSAQLPSLTCPRGKVDLYTTDDDSVGNGQLSKPVALLTADEMSFAGSGSSASNGSVYNDNSYLRSSSDFWLLSPHDRRSNGYADGFLLRSYGGGYLGSTDMLYKYGIRPSISLMHHIQITGGNGTAISPWTIE